VRKSDGRAVALKRILMHNEKEGMPVTALREIKIIKAMKHPSVIEILDMFVVRSESFEIQLRKPLSNTFTQALRKSPCLCTWSFRIWTTTWLAFLRTSAFSYSQAISSST
jgi:serine/threonine protein kinase